MNTGTCKSSEATPVRIHRDPSAAVPRPRQTAVPAATPAATGGGQPPLSGWTLVRFVVSGAAGNVAHAAVFLLLALTALPVVLVNVVAVVLSTVLANELHRRFTFRVPRGTSWFRGHSVGGAAAVTGVVLSSSALWAWHHLVPGASTVSGLFVVYGVTATVGLVNYLALRKVFRAKVTPTA